MSLVTDSELGRSSSSRCHSEGPWLKLRGEPDEEVPQVVGTAHVSRPQVGLNGEREMVAEVELHNLFDVVI